MPPGASARQGQGGGEVSAAGHRPAVPGPVDGFEEDLAAELLVVALVAVVDDVPLAARALDEGAVAARPPGLGGVGAAQERVVGHVLPGAVDGARARHDDHVPGGGPGGAADGGDEVVPAVAHEVLGPLQGVGLDDPVLGVAPAVVDVGDGAGGGQAVAGQAHAVDAAEEQVALAVLADGVARVDVAADAQVDGLGPLALDVVGPDDGDGGGVHARPGGRHEGDVHVEAALVLDQVGGEDAAPGVRAGGADRLPVDEVGRAPQDEGGAGLEGGEGEVVDVPHAQDGGVGAVAAHDGVAVGAVAEVGAALVLGAAAPGGGGGLAGGGGGDDHVSLSVRRGRVRR